MAARCSRPWRSCCAALLASRRRQAPRWEAGTDGLRADAAAARRASPTSPSTLSAAEAQALDAKLAAWEQKTGNQLAVLIVPTTQPEPIEAYSIRVADAWKIGRKGQDNGALLVVAKNDRKLRIEVGYGLEGVLTDVTSRRIIAETIAPLFRAEPVRAGHRRGRGPDHRGGRQGRAARGAPGREVARRAASAAFTLEMLLILVFVVVPILGGILRRIFGKALGSTVGAGVVGAARVDRRRVAAHRRHRRDRRVHRACCSGRWRWRHGGLARRGGGVWIPPAVAAAGAAAAAGGGFSGGGGGFGGGGASGGW